MPLVYFEFVLVAKPVRKVTEIDAFERYPSRAYGKARDSALPRQNARASNVSKSVDTLWAGPEAVFDVASRAINLGSVSNPSDAVVEIKARPRFPLRLLTLSEQLVCMVIIKSSLMKQRSDELKSKSELPSKLCPVCNRPFSWRKKWERDWDNVVYCSKRCRRQGRPSVAFRTGTNSFATVINVVCKIESKSRS